MNKQKFVSRFVARLEKERSALGMTQIEMARQLEMSLSGYKKMISGETSRIDLYTAYRLSLVTGKCISEYCLDESSELSDMCQKFRRLTDQQLRFVSGIVDFEISFLEDSHTEPFSDFVDLMIPTGNLRDGMIWDSIHVDRINASFYRKRFGDNLHCALQITSNNLHPVYNTGDILLISKTAPRDGDTVLLVNKETNRAYIRKLVEGNPWILVPINDYGISFEIDLHDKEELSKWIIYGHVLTKMRMQNTDVINNFVEEP